MRIFGCLLKLVRVDSADFVFTLCLALVLHFGELIWQPLYSHKPDLSSGLYILGVLLLILQPKVHACGNSIWIAFLLDSLKICLTLVLMQHVALVFVWDSCSWLINLLLHSCFLTFYCRLVLALLLLGYSLVRWLLQLGVDANEHATKILTAEYHCSHCAGQLYNEQLAEPQNFSLSI